MSPFCAHTKGTKGPTRRGAIVVLVAVVLVVLVGLLAVAVDTGVMMVRRTEVQRSVDAAVLAAASVLAQDEATESDVVAEALEFLGSNGVNPDDLDEDDIGVEFGTWNSDTRTFSNTGFSGATAVRVEINYTNNQQFFGQIFGDGTYSILAQATAVTTASNQPRDIMVVIDCSGSMDNDNNSPEQPMTAVKDAAQLLCDVVNDTDQVGLTVYNWENPTNHETGHLEVGLTSTVSFVKTRVNDLQAKFYTGGTNIAGGIREGGQQLNATARPDAERILVVLTDGKANDKEPPYESGYSADSSAIAWANDIRAMGIRIDSISLGNSADHDLMAEVAGTSLDEDDPLRGKHYPIEGTIEEYAAELQEVFQEIGTGAKRIAIVD